MGSSPSLINAYNAFTLELMLRARLALPASIRDLPDPQKQVRWTLAGERVSLDNIELASSGLFPDPTFATINCASVGCPPLRAGAFTGQLSEQLDVVTHCPVRPAVCPRGGYKQSGPHQDPRLVRQRHDRW